MRHPNAHMALYPRMPWIACFLDSNPLGVLVPRNPTPIKRFQTSSPSTPNLRRRECQADSVYIQTDLNRSNVVTPSRTYLLLLPPFANPTIVAKSSQIWRFLRQHTPLCRGYIYVDCVLDDGGIGAVATTACGACGLRCLCSKVRAARG